MHRLLPLLFLAVLVVGCREDPDAGARAAAPDTLASPPTDGAAPASAYPLAPGLAGTTGDGERFSLASLRGRPAVLVFYRGAYCGLCLDRLRTLDAHAADYKDAGARVVAVTVDGTSAAEHTRTALDLDFPVVSVHPADFRRWGLWREGESRPRPGEFVLDADGRVRYAHVGATAADRPGDVVLLGELEDLARSPAVASP